MNPLKKLASQTAIYGLSSVVGRLLNYLLVPLYTRYFIPEEYGVVTELYAYVAFLVIEFRLELIANSPLTWPMNHLSMSRLGLLQLL